MMKYLLLALSLSGMIQAATISVSQSYVVYDEVSRGVDSSTGIITVTNTTGGPIPVASASLSGVHSGDFTLVSDACSGVPVLPGRTCQVQVKFTPRTTGVKSALLDIVDDSAATTSIFLTNYESTKHKVKNLLPPVMNQLSIPEEMNASTTYSLSWSALGYHTGYKVIMAMFDCTGKTTGCAASYSDSEKFFETAQLAPSGSSQGAWSAEGVESKDFSYTYDFTVPAVRADDSNFSTSGTPVVIRFYAVSDEDSDIGASSLSLIIPGGLSNNYYDTSGRKVQKLLCPPGGCI